MLGDHFYVPVLVVVTCYFIIALGTVFGGWRIENHGDEDYKIKPVSGFCSDTASAFTLALATLLGVPVSTTQHGDRGYYWGGFY